MADLKELMERAAGIQGYVLASLTDEYIVDTMPMQHASLDGKEDKILEVRIFDENREVKLFRADIGQEFKVREIDDRTQEREYMDESQYLDIDTARSAALFAETHEVVTTGGGRFYFPCENYNDAKVVIRYYFDRYPRSGQARIADWRVVSLRR